MPRRSHAERFPEVPNPGGCLIEIRQAPDTGSPFTIWTHDDEGETLRTFPLATWRDVLHELSGVLPWLQRERHCPSVGVVFPFGRTDEQRAAVIDIVRLYYPEPFIPGVLGDMDIGGHAGDEGTGGAGPTLH